MATSDIVINPIFPDGTPNANILFEAVALHDEEKAVTFRAISRRFDSMGNSLPEIETVITIAQEGIVGGELGNGLVTANADGSYSVSPFNDLGITMQPEALRLGKSYSGFSIGDKFLFNVVAPDTLNPGNPGIPMDIKNPDGDVLSYNMSSTLSGTVNGVHIPYFSLDSTNGDVAVGDVIVNFMNLGGQSFPHSPNRLFTVDSGGSPRTEVTNIDTTLEMVYYFQSPGFYERKLSDDPAFYDASGNFVLREPRTLMLFQGDGSMASVTLYGNETFSELTQKLNDAIAFGLGQARYVDVIGKFASLADGTPNTSESAWAESFNLQRESEILTKGTLVMRSVVPGLSGELYFSGDEELLKALGLNTIQESRESVYTAAVYDAHSGALVNPAQQISGNILRGAVTSNIDVKFDPMANTDVSWNESMKKYDLTRSGGIYTTIVHLSDNTTILQVGANEAEDMAIHFGDMSASALGLDGLLMISRETASRSLGKVDNAIGLVSSMRAKLGAYQNRLEHTITNLTTSSTNTTAAESRIRDADMAKEMMEFTKLNILSQAGVSMMSKANQLPQNILELLK
ncbi:hypothetical protein FACS1894167_02330 [Synergistales bacterium]|nr:hypothetical protein FACS1894167_02330 [Synergistales bacterium]